MKKYVVFCSLAFVATNTVAANIEFGSGIKANFNGFASIVVGQTLDKEEVFLAEPISGGVYENELSLTKESIFGLKTKIDFSDKLSYTAQAIARSALDFELELDRSYISYQIDSNWNVSAGKKNLILFKYSDYLDVGYAYNFMRPPVPIYILPFNNYDGASITYKNYFGDYDFTIEAYTGDAFGVDTVSLSGVNSKLTFDFQDMLGVVFNLNAEDWNLRLGIHDFELGSELVGDILTEAAINGGMISQADADSLGLSNTDIFLPNNTLLIDKGNDASWVVGGGSYSPGNLLLNYEFFIYKDEKGFNEQHSHFVNVSYTLGKWTPTLGWSSAKETQDKKYAESPIGINQGVPATHYETLSFTLRYEVASNVATKFDITRYRDKGDTLTFGESTLISAGLYMTF